MINRNQDSRIYNQCCGAEIISYGSDSGSAGAPNTNCGSGSGLAVLRIRDVYPGSRILIFTHPGSRIQKQLQKGGVKKKLVVIPFL